MSEPIKNIKPHVWVFDTEYVPCVITGRKFHGLPESMPNEEVVKKMYEYAGATEEDPQPMLKSVFYRIVSIAAVLRSFKYNPDTNKDELQLVLHSVPREGDPFDEKAVVQGFLKAMGDRQPQIVGFASNMFDLTLLFQRAIILGCDVRAFCQRPAKPWDDAPDYFGKFNDYNIDLSQVLGGVRWLNPKLNEVALACGIPAKIGMDGSEVGPAWLEGRGREIVDYNEIDALTTYLLWLKVVVTCGLIDPEQALDEQKHLMAILEDKIGEGRDHLSEFYWQWHELNGLIPNFGRPAYESEPEEPTINEAVASIKKRSKKS